MLITSFILTGIISAGLIDHLGKISGEIEIKIPIFYLDNIDIIKEGEGYLRFEEEVNGTSFLLDSNKFYSDSLEVEKFYPMNFNIILEVKVSNLSINSTTGKISLIFIILIIIIMIRTKYKLSKNLPSQK